MSLTSLFKTRSHKTRIRNHRRTLALVPMAEEMEGRTLLSASILGINSITSPSDIDNGYGGANHATVFHDNTVTINLSYAASWTNGNTQYWSDANTTTVYIETSDNSYPPHYSINTTRVTSATAGTASVPITIPSDFSNGSGTVYAWIFDPDMYGWGGWSNQTTLNNSVQVVTPTVTGSGTYGGSASITDYFNSDNSCTLPGQLVQFTDITNTHIYLGGTYTDIYGAATLQSSNSFGLSAGNHVIRATYFDNYGTIVNTATGNLYINQAPLTVTATGINKTYDSNVTATVNLNVTPPAVGDVHATYASASFNNKNVGDGKTVIVNGISLIGANASNYYLYNTTATTTANITPRDLTAAVGGVDTKTYDGTRTAYIDPFLHQHLTGDDVTYHYAHALYDTPDVSRPNPKVVTVDGITITGNDASNYHLVR